LQSFLCKGLFAIEYLQQGLCTHLFATGSLHVSSPGLIAVLATVGKAHTMKPEDEQRAVAKLADELVERHPELPAEEVRQIVSAAHHELDGNPVRDFVPPLVSHAAREKLRKQDA
jgi:hypothetical protein